jgi:hypothetical protein
MPYAEVWLSPFMQSPGQHFTVEWEGNPLKVVAPQGLILLKSLRNSGQDQDDIEYLRSLENED